MKEETKYIKITTSLELAAFIWSKKKYKLVEKIHDTDGYLFRFEDSNHEFDNDVLNFYNGEKVNAIDYAIAMTALRGM